MGDGNGSGSGDRRRGREGDASGTGAVRSRVERVTAAPSVSSAPAATPIANAPAVVRPARAKHAARTPDAQHRRWGCTTTRRKVRWTVLMKETFLDHLAATCDIRQSALAIGVDPCSVYYLRRNDAGFAAAWGEALLLGYELLETQMIGHALTGGGREITNGAVELTGPVDVDLALRLLAAHRVDRAPRRHGRQRQVAAPEDTDAAILRKLNQLEKRAGGGVGAPPSLPEVGE